MAKDYLLDSLRHQPIVQDELVAQFNALGGDTRKQERFMAGLTANQVDKLVRWADS